MAPFTDSALELAPCCGAIAGNRTVILTWRAALRVPEERHESEVHVQLLVAVKERQARIIGDEVELELLESPQASRHPSRRRLSAFRQCASTRRVPTWQTVRR